MSTFNATVELHDLAASRGRQAAASKLAQTRLNAAQEATRSGLRECDLLRNDIDQRRKDVRAMRSDRIGLNAELDLAATNTAAGVATARSRASVLGQQKYQSDAAADRLFGLPLALGQIIRAARERQAALEQACVARNTIEAANLAARGAAELETLTNAVVNAVRPTRDTLASGSAFHVHAKGVNAAEASTFQQETKRVAVELANARAKFNAFIAEAAASADAANSITATADGKRPEVLTLQAEADAAAAEAQAQGTRLADVSTRAREAENATLALRAGVGKAKSDAERSASERRARLIAARARVSELEAEESRANERAKAAEVSLTTRVAAARKLVTAIESFRDLTRPDLIAAVDKAAAESEVAAQTAARLGDLQGLWSVLTALREEALQLLTVERNQRRGIDDEEEASRNALAATARDAHALAAVEQREHFARERLEDAEASAATDLRLSETNARNAAAAVRALGLQALDPNAASAAKSGGRRTVPAVGPSAAKSAKQTIRRTPADTPLHDPLAPRRGQRSSKGSKLGEAQPLGSATKVLFDDTPTHQAVKARAPFLPTALPSPGGSSTSSGVLLRDSVAMAEFRPSRQLRASGLGSAAVAFGRSPADGTTPSPLPRTPPFTKSRAPPAATQASASAKAKRSGKSGGTSGKRARPPAPATPSAWDIFDL